MIQIVDFYQFFVIYFEKNVIGKMRMSSLWLVKMRFQSKSWYVLWILVKSSQEIHKISYSELETNG